ncbi:MAG: Na+ dependent nucleoside transporter, partial [Eudoraea sp.]|nr:Na+ dependent nucleoside transporter [Eudoraea sp.]
MRFRSLITLFIFLFAFSLAAQEPSTIDSLAVGAAEIADQPDPSTIIPNQGFSANSLWRGALGMLVLVLIAFIFSAKRRAINWKTVGIGLGIQLILAVGILKVPFVQSIFQAIGTFFVKILDYTLAGSEFLLGSLLNVDNPNIGYVFAFQILPTIIFFSALTSVLFYLGVIQKVVKGLAWLLTKTLGISGAESLSVAGNI